MGGFLDILPLINIPTFINYCLFSSFLISAYFIAMTQLLVFKSLCIECINVYIKYFMSIIITFLYESTYNLHKGINIVIS